MKPDFSKLLIEYIQKLKINIYMTFNKDFDISELDIDNF